MFHKIFIKFSFPHSEFNSISQVGWITFTHLQISPSNLFIQSHRFALVWDNTRTFRNTYTVCLHRIEGAAVQGV